MTTILEHAIHGDSPSRHQFHARLNGDWEEHALKFGMQPAGINGPERNQKPCCPTPSCSWTEECGVRQSVSLLQLMGAVSFACAWVL